MPMVKSLQRLFGTHVDIHTHYGVTLHTHIYNTTEIDLLNKFFFNHTTGRWEATNRMSDPLLVHNKNIFMHLPSHDGSEAYLAQMQWIQHLEDDMYEASFKFCDNYPHDDGYCKWVVKRDDEEGFRLIMKSW